MKQVDTEGQEQLSDFPKVIPWVKSGNRISGYSLMPIQP